MIDKYMVAKGAQNGNYDHRLALLTGRGKLFLALLPQPFAEFHFPLEFVPGVLKPDFPLLEEAVQFVRVKTQKCGQLMLRQPMCAICLNCHILQYGARWITASRDHPAGHVIGQFDGNPHVIKIPSNQKAIALGIVP